MRRLLAFVKATHPAIENITSSSWLQNIPTYQALFPPAFTRRLAGRRDAFLGLWGQFVRWDGAANRQRYDAFIEKLQRAETIDAAIDTFPLQVLGAVGPLEDFYDAYDVR